jgi:plastocyanin
MSRAIEKRRGAALLAAVGWALLASLPAAAHGPSVRVSYDGIRPAEIVIRAGQTVHFQNTSSTPRTYTVVSDDGSFEGPTMSRGGGWHHTFETPGRFSYHLREQPDRRGIVIVAPTD